VLSQGTAEMFRAEVGYPIGYFWGYETDGVMQNEADVAAWVNAEGNPYITKCVPGDLRYVDHSGDGAIGNADKVMIGNPHPDFVFVFRSQPIIRAFLCNWQAMAWPGIRLQRTTVPSTITVIILPRMYMISAGTVKVLPTSTRGWFVADTRITSTFPIYISMTVISSGSVI